MRARPNVLRIRQDAPEREPALISCESPQITGSSQQGNAYVSIAVESFRKIATAKKVEMAVGNIEIKQQLNVERLNGLLDELDARMQQVNPSSSK